MKSQAALGEKSVNNKVSLTLKKGVEIQARVNRKPIHRDKENSGKNVVVAVKSDKIPVKKTLKKLGPEEIDSLQREKAIKILGLKEWKSPESGSAALTSTADHSGSNVFNYYGDSDRPSGPSGRAHLESELRDILVRMGGEGMVKSFDKRVQRLSSRIAGGRVLPKKEWSSLLSGGKLTKATKAKFLKQMGDQAALPSDTVHSIVRDGIAESAPKTLHDRNYSLGHFRSSQAQSKGPFISSDCLFDVNFRPEVPGLEHGNVEAVDSTLDTFQKCPSRLFMISLNFHRVESCVSNELILVMADGEVVTTYRRRSCWTGDGLIEACCLYQTLRCATPYELGLSPFLLDSAKLSSAVQLDFGLLSRLSNNGASTLPQWSNLIHLQSTPISFPEFDQFDRTTLVYRFEAHSTSPATVFKISRQEKFSYEQSVNARLHATPTSPLPAHLGASTDYFPSFDFGVSLKRLPCQVDQDTLDSLSVECGAKITPKHLEVLVTSTPTEGVLFWDAFKKGKTTPADLFNTVATVISAIEYAFHQGVMHSDMSLGNVLFCPGDKTARLFDFDGAEIIGDPSTGTNAGTILNMSINRLKSRSKPKHSRIDYSPLDDVEATVYYFLNMLLLILNRAVNANRVLGGMEAKLNEWAVQWEKCKWEARDSGVQEDDDVQAARAQRWDVDEASLQMITRYFQRYYCHYKMTKVLEQRSSLTLGPDLGFEEFPDVILRNMSERLRHHFVEVGQNFGLHYAGSQAMSEERLLASRNDLWDSGDLMEEIKRWIYVAAGDEGAHEILKGLDEISQWRDEAEFRDLWGHRPSWRSGEGEKEVESHPAKVERKCEELRAIFNKLKEAAHPFLERVWVTQVPEA